MKLLPWIFLALTTLYRHTWGRPDPEALRRRLSCAHRETETWQNEARHWRQTALRNSEIEETP